MQRRSEKRRSPGGSAQTGWRGGAGAWRARRRGDRPDGECRGLGDEPYRGLAGELRMVISSGDDYASTAKPQIDWDDSTARDGLIDSWTRDGMAVLVLAEGREVDHRVAAAGPSLA